jgi:hypothetical protein
MRCSPRTNLNSCYSSLVPTSFPLQPSSRWINRTQKFSSAKPHPCNTCCPTIQFQEVALKEALACLGLKLKTLDPEKKGVNIILAADTKGAEKITLSLRNVPLAEALRYITELAGAEMDVPDHAVFIGKR